jgi:hypothetical protein
MLNQYVGCLSGFGTSADVRKTDAAGAPSEVGKIVILLVKTTGCYIDHDFASGSPDVKLSDNPHEGAAPGAPFRRCPIRVSARACLDRAV